jgi:deoxyribonuclease-4
VKFGRHMPTSSKPLQAAKIAQELGCDTIQIFVNNPTSWRSPQGTPAQPGKPDAPAAFAQATREHGLEPVVVHAPYLINLASPDDDIFQKSVILLSQTAQRSALFGAHYVVFHIGSHRGAGVEAGIQRIVQGLELVLSVLPEGLILLLENDVGAGHELGSRLENLAGVLDALPAARDRLGVCLDTAHLWGAGVRMSTPDEVEQLLAEFDRLIGLKRLKAIHLNDTATPFGGHRDIHARIGEGIIPEAALRALLAHPAIQHVAVLLETPIKSLGDQKDSPDWAHDKAHLAQVKALTRREEPLAQAKAPRL